MVIIASQVVLYYRARYFWKIFVTCSNPCIDTGKRSLCWGEEEVRISTRLSRASNIKKRMLLCRQIQNLKKKLTSTPKEIIKLNTLLYKTTKIAIARNAFQPQLSTVAPFLYFLLSSRLIQFTTYCVNIWWVFSSRWEHHKWRPWGEKLCEQWKQRPDWYRQRRRQHWKAFRELNSEDMRARKQRQGCTVDLGGGRYREKRQDWRNNIYLEA